jgi:hypothetical protein
MNNVVEGFVGVFATGHDDKEFVSCVDNLDVMDGKLSVKGDGNDCFHGAVLEELSNFDVRDLHNMVSFQNRGKWGYICATPWTEKGAEPRIRRGCFTSTPT